MLRSTTCAIDGCRNVQGDYGLGVDFEGFVVVDGQRVLVTGWACADHERLVTVGTVCLRAFEQDFPVEIISTRRKL